MAWEVSPVAVAAAAVAAPVLFDLPFFECPSPVGLALGNSFDPPIIP